MERQAVNFSQCVSIYYWARAWSVLLLPANAVVVLFNHITAAANEGIEWKGHAMALSVKTVNRKKIWSLPWLLSGIIKCFTIFTIFVLSKGDKSRSEDVDRLDTTFSFVYSGVFIIILVPLYLIQRITWVTLTR